MGPLRKEHDYYEKNLGIPPTRAQYRSSFSDVPDFAYIECEDIPDTNHGIIWAHRLDHSPPDLFNWLMAYIDFKIELNRQKLNFAKLFAKGQQR